MNIILSKDEITNLTGYRRPSGQIRQLRAYGVRFFVAADGYPRVLRTDLEGKTTTKTAAPDFSALDRAANG